MSYIQIASACAVKVDNPKGISPAITVLEDEFRYHLSAESNGLPIAGTIDYDESLRMPSEAVMMQDKKLFACNNAFYLREGESVIRIMLYPEHFSVTAGHNTDIYALPVLLQVLLNFYLPSYQRVFLHAAAFSYNDKVYALHGFGGAGKSEVMVAALERGANYLADDLVVYDTEGKLYPYLRKIGLHDYAFTPQQLHLLSLNKRLYTLKEYARKRKGRIWNALHRRLKGRFNISVDHKILQPATSTPPIIRLLQPVGTFG